METKQRKQYNTQKNSPSILHTSKYVRLAAQIVLIHYNKVEETECVR